MGEQTTGLAEPLRTSREQLVHDAVATGSALRRTHQYNGSSGPETCGPPTRP
jgi:hypothetical protein